MYFTPSPGSENWLRGSGHVFLAVLVLLDHLMHGVRNLKQIIRLGFVSWHSFRINRFAWGKTFETSSEKNMTTEIDDYGIGHCCVGDGDKNWRPNDDANRRSMILLVLLRARAIGDA